MVTASLVALLNERCFEPRLIALVFDMKPDFELRLQVDLIVVEGARPVLRLLTPLAHHDDRSLNGREARHHEVEQDVGIGIEGLRPAQGIDEDPGSESEPKDDETRPTAAEYGKTLRGTFPYRAALVIVFLDVGRDRNAKGVIIRRIREALRDGPANSLGSAFANPVLLQTKNLVPRTK